MSDSFCNPYKRRGKPTLYGAAAREARLSDIGGVDSVIEKATEEAIRAVMRAYGLKESNACKRRQTRHERCDRPSNH